MFPHNNHSSFSGFRLKASVAQSAFAAITGTNSSKWYLLRAVLLMLILLATFVWLIPILAGPQKTLSLASFRPLSSMTGSELDATLSPDGKYLLYNHSLDLETDFQLVLQNLQTMTKQIVKFSKNAGLYGPVWRADQKGFYYQTAARDKLCEIREIKLSSDMLVVADNKLTSCGVRSFAARLQLTPDQQSLIYPSRTDDDPNIVLMQYEISSGVSKQLTSPPANSFGDYQSALSPDGRQLAFLRDVGVGKTAQVWLLDMETKSTRHLIDLPDIFPYMLSWSTDKQELFLPWAHEGVFALNLQSLQLEKRFHTNLPMKEVTQLIDGKYLVATGSFWHSNLVKLNNPLVNKAHSTETVADSSGGVTEFVPNPQPSGPAAVVSHRSGEPHLWLHYADGRQQQLSTFPLRQRYQAPLFSPDGKKLLLLSSYNLWLFQADKPPLKLIKDDTQLSTVFWGADSKTVYYSQIKQGQKQVMKQDIVSQSVELFSAQLQYYQPAADGGYALQRRNGQDGYELVDLKTGLHQQLPELKRSELVSHVFHLRKQGIYFYRLVDSDFEVARLNLKNKQVESTGLSSKVQGRRFDVSPDEQFIYLDDGQKGDIDIGYLVLPTE